MSINTLERDVARLLQEGQDAARRGDRAMSRALLTQLVEQDPRNEEAWMWLSGVVTDVDEQQICLENALVINPYNAHARKGLEFVLTKTGTPPRVPLVTPTPVVSPVAVPVSASAPALATQPPDVVDAPAAQIESLPGAEALEVEQLTPLAAPSGDSAPAADGAPDAPSAFALSTGDVLTDFDGEPFIPPGMEEMMRSPTITGPTGNLLNATPDQVSDELPSWLQELTPSTPAASNAQDEAQYSPFGMPDYSQPSNGAGMAAAAAMAAMPPVPAPAAPFGPADLEGMGDFGMGAPVGPFSETQMPSPHELPGGMDGFGAGKASSSAQPWYLQGKGGPPQQGNGSAYLDSTMLKSGSLNSAMLTSAAMDEMARNKVVATMPCPNCETQVNETSLACAHCGYSFFVNCPFCHELIDTSEVISSKIEPCPYCAKDIDRWKLGLGGVPDLVSQKNPGSRPADSGKGPDPAFPAMKQTLQINTQRKKGLSFGWMVDLLWLIAIVAMVWALTQLPNWLHLSGQY